MRPLLHSPTLDNAAQARPKDMCDQMGGIVMGLFSRKKTPGTFKLDFIDVGDVSVRDSIPDGTDESPYPLMFALLFAARALSDAPEHSGEAAVQHGIDALSPVVDPDDALAYNGSMLGVVSDDDVSIVDGAGSGQWICEGVLFEKDGELDVDARITHAFGDSLHRASVDAVLETTRRRMGESGGAVCSAALDYFEELKDLDCPDDDANCRAARNAAVRAADLARAN